MLTTTKNIHPYCFHAKFDRGSGGGQETVKNDKHSEMTCTIPQTAETTSEQATEMPECTRVIKPAPPLIPPKTADLYQELKEANDPPFVAVGKYTDISSADATDKETYSEVRHSDNTISTSPSGPVHLSEFLCNTTEDKPDYVSSESTVVLMGNAANGAKEDGEEIYRC